MLRITSKNNNTNNTNNNNNMNVNKRKINNESNEERRVSFSKNKCVSATTQSPTRWVPSSY